MTKILTLAGYYLPGFKMGGPVRTISNVVEHLGDDFKFQILTRDRDYGDINTYPNIKLNSWHQVGKAQVIYLSSDQLSFAAWNKRLSQLKFDVMYLNSFFEPLTIKTLISRRLGKLPDRPIILAPRGEFSSSALAFKPSKKKAYLLVSKSIGLFQKITWHASSQYEAKDIQRIFSINKWKSNIHVAPNLSPLLLFDTCPSNFKKAGKAHIIFLSRIAQMKNLDYALKVLAQVKGHVQFDIYGPKEDKIYWGKCETMIKQLPSNIQVKYHGSVPAEQVSHFFAQANAFLFPTLGENFGHVILEALSVGCVPILSDRTPWSDLTIHNAGWNFRLDNFQSFVDKVEEIVAMDQQTLELWSHSAWRYAKRFVNDPSRLQANKDLFIQAIEKNE